MAVLQVGEEGRGVHHAVVDVAQPSVPPGQGQAEEVDAGSRDAEVRVHMAPRPRHAPTGGIDVFEEAQDRVGPAVVPAADRKHRNLDPVVLLAHRSPHPTLIPELVLEPGREKHWCVVESFSPHGPPSVSDDSRVWWADAIAEHHCTPAEALSRVAPHQVATIVVVAVD